MERELPGWCKAAKIELVKRDMSITELAEKIGKTREWTSAVVNGRVYSEPTMKEISDYLNIENESFSIY